MKYSVLTAAALAPLAFAAPAKRQSTNIDPVVLQFALTLEHLENVFYKGVLAKFSAADFAAAGYGSKYYENIKYIAADEQSHVTFLTTALAAAGASPVQQCTYNFPYTDVNSFITLSSVIEGVGTSAYLGGAPLITSKDYLTAAGSILVTEALHTSLQRQAVNKVFAANPYGTPLDPTSVYTLAASFIVSCPSTNFKLPFTPFPGLALTTTSGTCEYADCSAEKFLKRGWTPTAAAPAPAKQMPALMAGAKAAFNATAAVPSGSFLTFVSGLSVTSVAGSVSGTTINAAIPATAMGQTYVFVTKSAAAGNKLDGTSVLFGPAILEVGPPML